MGVVALSIKGNGEVLVTLDSAVLGDGRRGGLALGARNRNRELKLVVRKVGSRISLRDLNVLLNLKRPRQLKRELAVVAQVGVDIFVAGGPFRVPEGACGRGRVRGLVGVQLGNVGQAGRTLLEDKVALGIRRNGTRDALGDAAQELLDRERGSRRAVCADVVEIALIVIRRVPVQRALRALCACRVGIQRAVLRDVVIAVLLGRGKGGDGVAVLATIPPVGQEEDLAVLVLVVGDVRRHIGIGIGEKLLHAVFEAGPEEDADGERGGDGAGALVHVDLEVAQRDEGRRNLDRDLVTGLQVGRPLDRDDDAAEVALGIEGVARLAVKHIGVDIAVGGLGVDVKDLVGKDDVVEVIDLHVITELVGEGHVARLVLHALGDVGGIAGRIRDLLGDVIEDGLELVGVGGRLVEIRVLLSSAKIPVVAIPRRHIGCVGIVAGNSLHKLVLVAGSVSANGGRRIGTRKNANSVDGTAIILDCFCRGNRLASHLVIKITERRWGAVSKEDDNLASIRTTGCKRLCQLHAMIRPSSTCRTDAIDRRLEAAYGVSGHERHGLHNLAVVVSKLTVAVGVVTNAVGPIACKLHNGNHVLLVCIRSQRISRRNLIDEGVCCLFEGLNALGAIPVAHRVIHGPGRIQHEHDVERRGRRLVQVGRGRNGAEGRQEVRIALLDGLVTTRTRKDDVAVRDGLVRPNAPDVLRRALAVVTEPGAPVGQRRWVRNR